MTDKQSSKKLSIREMFQNIASGVRDFFDPHSGYIQMRLPVEKITKKFENSLKDKVDHEYIHADVREAKREDLNDIMKLYNQAWHSSKMPIREVGKDKFIKIFEDPDTVFLIAEVDNSEVGFILLDLEGDKKEIGVIAGLGVLPRCQHKGLGTILGLASWNFFKERGIKELRCEVYKDNDLAYKFIKNLGFEEYRSSGDHLLTFK
ncbi:MAG: GNAT family N-acetyltransferase [Promethearchaeota archaeon]|nr:MAG: GNAT family N-acetyltransferase [Candidatus Lokiarchaeota archaeon]